MTAIDQSPPQTQEPTDLAILVRRHQAGVWRYVRFLGADQSEADDLTQETFLALARGQFVERDERQTAGYLRVVARNQLLALRRRQNREVSTVELEAADSVWAAASGPDGSLNDYLDALRECVEQLEGRVRQVIDLHYRDHAGREAIASQLDMQPDGVKTLLAAPAKYYASASNESSKPNQPLSVGRQTESTAMNASHNTNDTTTSNDDHPDRLLDFALSELIGGHAPPDLSNRISAANIRPAAVLARPPRARERRAFWASLAVAVMLLISATTVVVLQVRSVRQGSSTTVAKVTEMQQIAATLQEHHDTRQVLPQTGRAAAKFDRTGNATVKSDWVDAAQVIESTVQSKNKTLLPEQQLPQLKSDFKAKVSRAQSISDPEGRTQIRGAGTLSLDAGIVAQSSSDKSDLYAFSDPAKHRSSASTSLGTAPSRSPSPYYLSDDVRYDANEVPGFTARPTSSHGYVEGKDGSEQYSLSLQDNSLSMIEGGATGPSRDQYSQIIENPVIKAEGGAAVSTFSIDVDTASYANVRQFLLDMNQLPPRDAVRIEELINYFHYDYAPPISPTDPVPFNTAMANAYVEAKAKDFPPFAAHVEVTGCPWAPEHRLARIGIKGREMDRNKRPQSNLVFLVDVSGSMNEPAKLPLVVYGLEQLTRELGENDHIAIVVYAGTEGLVLPSTSGSKQDTILAALAKLQAGGSTAGGAGIQLAYQIAEDNFIKGGTNRVILCTDGDFNVGITSTAELQRMVEKKAKETGVFISTLGFGRGNLNDAMMVAISDHGNGNYHYIDNRSEARRVLVQEMTGTLVTIAKDVKIQVEFNPVKVAGYRLIGYEKRMLKTEDFNDDKKDAGEIGAGHTVTALYEIVPAGKQVETGGVDALKYQQPATEVAGSTDKPSAPSNNSKELLTLKMRYKAPDGDTSKKLEWAITDDGKSFSAASGDLKFAAAVAGFGLLLRDSKYKGNLTYPAVLELAQGGIGEDPHGYRKEFLDMVRRAKELRHE